MSVLKTSENVLYDPTNLQIKVLEIDPVEGP